MPQAFQLQAIEAFSDNYIWMLHDGSQALVVDPGEAAPVIRQLQAQHLRLAGILVTHHHADHIGGVEGLRPWLDGPVLAPPHPANPKPCQSVSDGQSVRLMELAFQVIASPGHTLDHVCYHLPHPADGEAGLLFCGDTLFSGGCGRLFEGTARQMWDSLRTLTKLPGDTRVCCAHEYTLSNLRFAGTVEPANASRARHEAWCVARREQGLPTLPSTLALELEINPFLRCQQAAVQTAALAHPSHRDQSPELQSAQDLTPALQRELNTFSALRQWKNEFR